MVRTAVRRSETKTPTSDEDYKLVHFEFLRLKALALLEYFKEFFNFDSQPFKDYIENFYEETLEPFFDSLGNELFKFTAFFDKMVTNVLIFVTNVWKWMNFVLMYPVTAQFMLIALVLYLARQYNYAVLRLRKNYYLAKHIPLIPIERISTYILKDPIYWLADILEKRAAAFKKAKEDFIKHLNEEKEKIDKINKEKEDEAEKEKVKKDEADKKRKDQAVKKRKEKKEADEAKKKANDAEAKRKSDEAKNKAAQGLEEGSSSNI